jgi:hypothetical protein
VLRLAAACVAALVLAPAASAGGGSYVFFGGNRGERAQVRRALNASTFDWNAVPVTVSIHIVPGVPSHATPAAIWLDPALLHAGMFSWAVVQDEYAHQVDWFLLDDSGRAQLNALLGARVWCHADLPGLAHGAYGCERFTSMLVWAYWPSRADVYRPGLNPEARFDPQRFRAVLDGLLAA